MSILKIAGALLSPRPTKWESGVWQRVDRELFRLNLDYSSTVATFAVTAHIEINLQSSYISIFSIGWWNRFNESFPLVGIDVAEKLNTIASRFSSQLTEIDLFGKLVGEMMPCIVFYFDMRQTI